MSAPLPRSRLRRPTPVAARRVSRLRTVALATRPAVLAVLAVVTVALTLAGCGGSPAPDPTPTLSQLQIRLAALPKVSGASANGQDVGAAAVRETWSVPAGSPACLQILAVLHASGYDVVAGPSQATVDPETCTTDGDESTLGPAGGTATVLAQGGSTVGLSWTPETYTLEADGP